jgi:hypothetical protein
MAYLTSQQRNSLERAVVAARKAAELGAQNALISLAVDQPHPFPSLTPEQMNLREQLRIKARLLGDVVDDSSQSIDHVVNELAYEYWHKMLFARFLEANNLLMHPDGVPVSMEECEELAPEMGLEDKWDVASTFASMMLPAIFRPTDPVLQVRYATNDRIKLESILDDVDATIFLADDSLGWVYQFWQSEAKAVINASGEKIDGEKLPAVTQLFTEPYMVHFLIDNTIGAWWTSRNKGVKLPALFEYLRTTNDGRPEAGEYPGWPDRSAELKCMDLCMGSGHIIVAVFVVLVKLRMYEEGLPVEVATDSVISDNIHGLELDPRCTQIAAFNLALTAWKTCGRYKELPEMNLACSGIAPTGIKSEWLRLVGNVASLEERARMENGMAVLYEYFKSAPYIGSLLDPNTIQYDAMTARMDVLHPVLLQALANENDSAIAARGVMASGIAKAAQLLSRQYALQIANVPYLTRSKHGQRLMRYCETHHSEAKGDLATVFLERMIEASCANGTLCCVMPQGWTYLSSFMKLRRSLLSKHRFDFIVKMGAGAFSQISGEVVKVALFGLTKAEAEVDHEMMYLDLSDERTLEGKRNALLYAGIERVQQDRIENTADCVIAPYLEMRNDAAMGEYFNCYQGLRTGDMTRFIRYYWEIPEMGSEWELFQTAGESSGELFSGMTCIIFWESGRGQLYDYARRTRDRLHDMHESGNLSWGKRGVAIAQMGAIKSWYYSGERYDGNLAVLTPKSNYEEYLPVALAYALSPEYNDDVRKLNQGLYVTNSTLIKVPFDTDRWLREAEQRFPDGLPSPYSNDPKQWVFHGNPKESEYPLQIAILRMLGYRWPSENRVMDVSDMTMTRLGEARRFDSLCDADGIVCIPSVNGEMTCEERLRDYIRALFQDKWNNHSLSEILAKKSTKERTLETWLRNVLFEEHSQLFQNRPFIWQIWDGRKDGFSVLVNYHKLTKENLQKLIYGYLGDWIRQCESKMKTGESGAEGLVVAATTLQNKLKLILEGETPYDIFVRWKPLHEQSIGWEPDLNDGVRINIRPFIEAGVLRKKVKIKYGIDRGKNPPGSPWGEIRDNDRHLTLAEKREAREKRKNK